VDYIEFQAEDIEKTKRFYGGSPMKRMIFLLVGGLSVE
jgi:hypothetical protein